MRRQMVIARIFILINQLDKDTLLQRLRPFQHPDFKWVREYPRLSCYILVDFASGDKAYRSCIRDISASGVFIESTDTFKVGQEIALCFTISDSDERLPFKTKGKVTRIYPDGIGVQYQDISHYQRDILDALVKHAP
jgi:Tfp pilus assembly protein PilZ